MSTNRKLNNTTDSKATPKWIHKRTHWISFSRYSKSRLLICYHQNNIFSLVPYVVFLHMQKLLL